MPGLPLSANTTCDIYRQGRSPPSAPDVAGVSIQLSGDFRRREETGEGDGVGFKFTHIALIPKGTDVRDMWDVGGPTNPDTIYVPDKNGTGFTVRFIERAGIGTASEMRRVYLDRKVPTWPTNEL
jgi:hypothetical protein